MAQEMQAPIPNRERTLECHGVRGVYGDNTNAQLAPLNARYSKIHPQLKREDLSKENRLRIELEVFILEELVGYSGTTMAECYAVITAAYKRPFSEWFMLAADTHRAFDTATLRQQLANAWREIENLLSPPC